MQLSKIIHDTKAEITLAGQFTFADNAVFREVMVLISDPEMRQIHVNVQRLLSIDSAGLGMFLLAKDEAKYHQKILTLTHRKT